MKGLCAVFVFVGAVYAEPGSCDCGAHGHCEDGHCLCETGYFGPACADNSCVQDCRGHGVCGPGGVCFCEDGWAGQNCATRAVDMVLAHVAESEETAVNSEIASASQMLRRVSEGSAAVPPPPTVVAESPVSDDDASRQARATRRAATDEHLTLVDQLLSQLVKLSKPAPVPAVPPVAAVAPAPAAPARTIALQVAKEPPPHSLIVASRPAESWGRPALRGAETMPALSALQRAKLLAPVKAPDHADHEDGVHVLIAQPAPAAPHGPNITVESVVYNDELGGKMDIADGSSVIWEEQQKYAATAACGGCGGHGICDSDTKTCMCDYPFFGTHCTSFHEAGGSCDLDCGKHGFCAGDPSRCVCHRGWSGPDCHEEACLDDCHGQGTCINKVCACNDLFIGASCGSRRCVNDCLGRGECVNAKCQCDTGYEGETCELLSPPKESVAAAASAAAFSPLIANTIAYIKTMPLAVCPEGCSQHGKCDGATCTCYTGYTGASCENFCPNFCSHQGECIEGACLCVAGFIGVDCSVSACCNGHGDCSIPDTCICSPGWMGASCGIPSPCFDAMCNGHGTCDQGTATCQCEPGWTGSKCVNPPEECPVCQHGTCNRLQERCECDAGFTGADCSEKEGGLSGAMQRTAADKKKAAEAGTSGPLADVGSPWAPPTGPSPEELEAIRLAAEEAARRAAEAKKVEVLFCGENKACSGHGSCNSTAEECLCNAGWDGDICDFEHCPGYNATAGIDDCSGHGMCTLGACYCAPGWGVASESGAAMMVGAADTCAERVCASGCSNHGKCVEGECQCEGGWTGNTCHKPACPKDCSGHGTCSFWAGSDSPGECECFPGFMGGDCAAIEVKQRTCPNDCNGNGLCMDGRCMCSDGFRGPDCGDAVCSDPLKLGPECDIHRCKNDCQGQGLCFNGVCDCWAGLFGADCGIPRDCLEACGETCKDDSRTPHCSGCLGDCEMLVAGGHIGHHSWTEDVRT